MDQSNKADFALAIGAMFASFGQDSTPAIIHGYWLGLADMDISDVQRAVAMALQRCKFLPKPTELRELVGASLGEEENAIAAWSDVQRAVGLGPYKHIDFEDKLCNAVIRNMGGWPSFIGRLTDSEAEKWVRLEFIKCYRSFARSGVNGELIQPLAGLSSAEVVSGRIGDPVPRLVTCEANRRVVPMIPVSSSEISVFQKP